jgi:hypothetical protein
MVELVRIDRQLGDCVSLHSFCFETKLEKAAVVTYGVAFKRGIAYTIVGSIYLLHRSNQSSHSRAPLSPNRTIVPLSQSSVLGRASVSVENPNDGKSTSRDTNELNQNIISSTVVVGMSNVVQT